MHCCLTSNGVWIPCLGRAGQHVSSLLNHLLYVLINVTSGPVAAPQWAFLTSNS